MSDVDVQPTASDEQDPATSRGDIPTAWADVRAAHPFGPDQAARLSAVLDGRWGEVRRQIRPVLERTSFGPVIGDLSTAEHRERTLGILHEIAAARADAPVPNGFPVAVGGDDDIGGSVTLVQMLGHADLSVMVKAGVQWGLFGGAITALGTEEHHRRYLPPTMDLSVLGCFAMSETGHGSDVESARTTATYDADSDEIEVHTPSEYDRKDYIGNAAQDASLAVVFAQLVVGGESHGVHAVVVPIRDESGAPLPGITIEDDGRKGGLNGVDNGRIGFDHVRVPRTNLLNRFGDIDEQGRYSSPIENPKRRFFTMLGTLVRGRASVGAAAAAATESALTIATRYATSRTQFERPDGTEVTLLDYQQHRRSLLPALATSIALRFALDRLTSDLHDHMTAGEGSPAVADAADRGDDSPSGDDASQRELETRAAALKVLATDHANATVQACREACGGAGYLAENLLVQLRGDVDVFATFEGDNTVLLQLVAKGMLSGYTTHIGELDTIGTVRFAVERFGGTVIERTAAAPLIARLISSVAGRNGDSSIDERGWHLRLFEARERHQLETAASRLRSRMGNDADPFDAFNACQHHLLVAARSHGHRVVLEAFLDAIDHCEDPQVAVLLDTVCDLYVLAHVEADRGWFLEHGRISPARSKLITAAVDTLCDALRPHALTLVDAFGVPPHLVDAAMLHRG